jgi:hypothetical protein
MATNSAVRKTILDFGFWTLGFRRLLARLDRGLVLLALVFVLTFPLLTPRVAASDEIEYFSYLHSLFFDHDLNFRNEYEHFCNLNYADCVQSRFKETFLDDRTPTGLQINFGPIGSALLWTPFYLAAHPVALALHHFVPSVAADGYSAPYIYAISFASLLYGWLGLAFAYLLARDFVEEKIAVGATLAILFATNAVYYLYVAPAMSHADSLFASALFVFIWYRTRVARARGDWKAWVLLGACGALMTMVREQEGLFILIPVVESVITAARSTRTATNEKQSKSLLEQPIRAVAGDLQTTNESTRRASDPFIRSLHPLTCLRLQLVGLAMMGITWLVVFIPQFVVYRVLNGNFLPAKDVTQKFTWNGAHIPDILFSNLNGLFSWTPLVLFAVLGLFLLWRRDRVMAAAFLVAFAAEVYLLGSFSTWFGGAAFGMRRFVNCTILFVLGLALLVDWLKPRVPLRVQAGLGALFTVWNLFFIVQFATGMIARGQPVDFAQLAYNQVVVVPQRLGSIAWRFFTARSTYYKR